MQAGDDASYHEWTEGNYKYYGMRKLDLKHGIVRTIYGDGFIQEATYYKDKEHGLSFAWLDDIYPYAFSANIHDHG